MIYCKDCRHFNKWTFNDCDHPKCFKYENSAIKSLEIRVMNIRDLNKNNDCVLFEPRSFRQRIVEALLD